MPPSIKNFMGLVMAAAFVISVAAVEPALGLSIMISFYKVRDPLTSGF